MPDVVRLDFAISGMNRAALAAEIRPRWRALPIAFANGFADAEAIRAVETGAIILRKPFRMVQLPELLGTAMDRRRDGS